MKERSKKQDYVLFSVSYSSESDGKMPVLRNHGEVSDLDAAYYEACELAKRWHKSAVLWSRKASEKYSAADISWKQGIASKPIFKVLDATWWNPVGPMQNICFFVVKDYEETYGKRLVNRFKMSIQFVDCIGVSKVTMTFGS